MNTHTNTPSALDLVQKYQHEIPALMSYLARTGFPPAIVAEATAAAVAAAYARPDIARPLAYMTTFARGEAEMLRAKAIAAGQDAGPSVPDLMDVLSPSGQVRTARRRRTPATAKKRPGTRKAAARQPQQPGAEQLREQLQERLPGA